MAVLRAVRRAAAVLFLLAAATPRVAGFSSYGDRPGQLRRSAFSSYGRKSDAHTNDPRRWKHKASAAKLHEDGIQYVLPGSREALAMHKNDGKLMERLKDQKRRSRTRSSSGPSSSTRSRTLSARSRTASVAGRSRTRSKSEGLASRAKARVLEYLERSKTTVWDALRVLRLSRVRKNEVAPAGKWTAKSRPVSLIPPPRLTKKQKLKAKLRLKKAEAAGAGKKARSRSGSPKSRSASPAARSASPKRRSGSPQPKARSSQPPALPPPEPPCAASLGARAQGEAVRPLFQRCGA